MRRLDAMGYRGDYSFEVFNDDYVQLPLAVVAERARQSVKWLTGQVPRRSLPRGARRASPLAFRRTSGRESRPDPLVRRRNAPCASLRRTDPLA